MNILKPVIIGSIIIAGIPVAGGLLIPYVDEAARTPLTLALGILQGVVLLAGFCLAIRAFERWRRSSFNAWVADVTRRHRA